MTPESHTASSDEALVRVRIEEERARLYREAGLEAPDSTPYQLETPRPFTKADRHKVTILFGGLSRCHDRLIHAVGRSRGYKVETIPTPTRDDYHVGREFTNNGMCNPTYFTVGALISYLRRLRDERGLTPEQIRENYVFVTAASCGPCRFGVYESEYRLALRNSGFDGLRVATFQQTKLTEMHEEFGIELTPRVLLPVFEAVLIADILNAIAQHVRPYEHERGRTDAALGEAMERMAALLSTPPPEPEKPSIAARLIARCTGLAPRHIAYTISHCLGDRYTSALTEAVRAFDEVEVDYTRPRPVVKITGEFWAQTTEGDGNFRMFSFLEGQGAEVIGEPVSTWFLYLIAQAWAHVRDREGLTASGEPIAARDLATRGREWIRNRAARIKLALGYRLFMREYERLRHAAGATTPPQADQFELARLAHPFYNRNCLGGEGHMEVGKTIYYATHDLAHLVLSLKPFGCLPSTQSDGAQAAVAAAFPCVSFLPIETSGDGEINAYSRVQMALGEARERCTEEFDACLRRTGRSIDEIRRFVEGRPDLRSPFTPLPHVDGVAGRAARFVIEAARRMDAAERNVTYGAARTPQSNSG